MKQLSGKEMMERVKLIAVLTIGDVENAAPVAKALYEGGVKAVEITFRTTRAAECIRRVREEVPDMFVGAGTILTPSQVADAKAAGAHFGVAPGANATIIKAAKAEGLFFAPGVFTPSDIELALEHGCTAMKYFPAASLGMAHLLAMSAPYRHLGVKFIPLGGVNESNLKDFVTDPLIVAVGGSWLATPEMIENLQTSKIRDNARRAYDIIKSA